MDDSGASRFPWNISSCGDGFDRNDDVVLLFLQGVHDIGPVRASMISSVEPVSATLFSVLWLGTVMTTMDLVGMACILVMVIILSVKE